MDLERMAVRLRPRNAFEALDLGISLVRANWRSVYAAWFAVYAPAAVIVHLLLREDPFWAWVVLWWLKPAFDRAILAVLAPALLGEPRPAREFLRAPTRAFRRTGLFPALTWRRLDIARSFHLPVHQLERLRGKAMRARLRILDRDSRGAAVWLTFLLSNLELILLLAISLALTLLLPVQTPIDTILEAWGKRQFGPSEGGLAGSVIGAISVALVEPFYVGCGFTLYLQRRTHLEGWDIELRFRQLAARVAQAAGATLAALVLCVLLPQGNADAATKEEARPAKAAIREVLADSAFGHEEPVKRLKYVGPVWKQEKKEGWDWSWLQGLADFFAGAVRVISWAAAIAAIAVALYFLARYVRLRGLARGRGERPDFLFGLDVRPGSLPDDVAGEAEALARRGEARAALSLLYRGALVRFLDEGVEFLQGDTEGDCVRRVEGFASRPRRVYFMKLVLAWQAQAYAHRGTEAESLVALAREWRGHFDRASSAANDTSPQPA